MERTYSRGAKTGTTITVANCRLNFQVLELALRAPDTMLYCDVAACVSSVVSL